MSEGAGENRLGFGIAALCFAALTFSMMIACVKLLGAGYSPLQVLLMRYVFSLALALPLLWRERASLWRSERPGGGT